MNVRNIKKRLNRKFDNYLNSIEDKKIRKIIQKHTIVTGGCIPSMLLDEKVNDYDIYFTDLAAAHKVCEYYIAMAREQMNEDAENDNSSGEDNIINSVVAVAYEGDDIIEDLILRDIFFLIKPPLSNNKNCDDEDVNENDTEDNNSSDEKEKRVKLVLKYKHASVDMYGSIVVKNDDTDKKYTPVCFTQNSITLSDGIQLIIRFVGDPKEIHKNYDFVHCTCWWRKCDNKLVLPQKALLSLLTKELIYTGSKYPLASIIRTRKFIKRGFNINAGQYVKMCMQLNDMDLRNTAVLREQLIGVDLSFFVSLLQKIKDEKIDKKIDSTYIMTLIDEAFDDHSDDDSE